MSDNDVVTASGGKPLLNDFDLPSGRAINGIDPTDWDTVERLLRVWREKRPGNVLRSAYYNAHERLKDFGISMPGKITSNVKVPVGWPAKAVRTLSDLSAFEGFSVDGTGTSLGSDVRSLFESNCLDTVMSQAIVSAYKHSCAFLTVSAGDDGMPVVIPRSADWSAAIWDMPANRIASALTITDADEYGNVTGFNVWLADRIYVCSRGSNNRWGAQSIDTNLGRPSVVALCYDPQLDRPFGRSRITRPLMSLTDIAFRTIVRMEGNAEFYSVPKIWFLGMDRSALKSDTWSSLVSAINAVSRDANDEIPTMQQISQASMQPHSDMLRTIAMLVASETSLPVNDLGITMDNPASAEAMAAAERKLSREADRQNRLFSRALKDVVGMALNLAPDDLARVTPVWAPTREVSDAARADYYAKVAGVNQDFADSDIGLMKAGLTFAEIQSFRAYQQRKRAQERIDQIQQQITMNRQGGDVEQTGPSTDIGRQAATSGNDSGPADQELSG